MDLTSISTRGAVLLVMAAVIAALAGGLANAPANRAANRWLALFLLVLVGLALDYAAGFIWLSSEWRWVLRLPLNASLALGPLIWIYLTRLVRGAMPKLYPIHMLPALVQIVWSAVVFVAPAQMQTGLLGERLFELVSTGIDLALPLSIAVYAIASLNLVFAYRKWAVGHRSDAEDHAGRWIRNLLIALVLTVAAETVIRLAGLTGRRIDRFDVYPFYVWLICVGAYLGVEARRYRDRPFPPLQIEVLPKVVVSESEKDWAALGAAWREKTYDAGWWREPGLTLPELARRLGVNRTYLSRAINDGLNQNFSEMINTMRADAVAAELTTTRGADDLLHLALDAGFGSKASFNRAFRARHGMAPSTYRDRRLSS